MKFVYEHADSLYTVLLEKDLHGDFHLKIDEREYTLKASRQLDGTYFLKLGNQTVLAYCEEEDNLRYVAVNGKSVSLLAIDERIRKATKSSGAGDLTAQMPGQVLDVLVKAGDVVSNGQTLVILEAMKMELRVTAPLDGRVKQVLVRPGEVIGRGQKLVELERNP